MIGDNHPHRTTEGRQFRDLNDREVCTTVTSEALRHVAEIETRAEARDLVDSAAAWAERNSQGVVSVKEIERYGSEVPEYELMLQFPNHAHRESARKTLEEGARKAVFRWGAYADDE